MISSDKIKQYIGQIDESLPWNQEELDQLSTYFNNIYQCTGREIYTDVEISDAMRDEYALRIIDHAILEVLNRYAKSICIVDRGKFYITLNKSVSKFKFIRTCKYVDKIDLNTATAKELEAVEGLGKAIAERIVKTRTQNGCYNSVNDLLKIRGIGEKTVQEMAYSLYVSKPNEVFFYHPVLVEFKNKPSLTSYFKVLELTGGAFSSRLGIDRKDVNQNRQDLKNIILSEISKISESISCAYSTKIKRMIPTSEISSICNRTDKFNALMKTAAADIKGVTILEDTDYYYFLDKIIEEAKSRILITMFLMYTAKDKESSTTLLIKKLIAASKRGVDVRVILDRSKNDSINCNTYELLKDSGVKVAFDTKEVKTHTKMVVIDQEHLIIGSHNWTSGSFYQYDDKSIYIVSEALVKESAKEFEAQWIQY